MSTLDYILEKFNITIDEKTQMPIEIPNFGRDQLAVLFAEAILPYVKDNKIFPWFVLGLRAKIPGMIRDRHRSWMWVKQ